MYHAIDGRNWTRPGLFSDDDPPWPTAGKKRKKTKKKRKENDGLYSFDFSNIIINMSVGNECSGILNTGKHEVLVNRRPVCVSESKNDRA